MPEFRLLVKPVPLGLHHRLLVDAPTFDLDDHLAHTRLPAPGGDADLDRLYGRLAEEHLDRRRPLWRLTLVGGLEEGRQALILQVQHCLMDGAGTGAALARIFGAGTVGTEDRDSDPGTLATPHPSPGPVRVLAGGVARQLWTLGRFPGLLNRTRRGAAAAKARASRSGTVLPREGVDAPVCSINTWRSAQRRFARVSVDLADMRIVREAAARLIEEQKALIETLERHRRALLERLGQQ